jgi:hypothetical protein
MKHLSPERLVELAEGDVSDRQAADHLTRCEACRHDVTSLREMISRAADVDDLPASPLLWEHFPARVREAIEHEEPRATRRAARWTWLSWPMLTTLAASMVVFVAVVVAWQLRAVPAHNAPLHSASLSATGALDAGDALLPRDASWSLVAEAGAHLDADAAADLGFGVRPGSAERAAAQLSRDERAELARLLRAEIRQGS